MASKHFSLADDHHHKEEEEDQSTQMVLLDQPADGVVIRVMPVGYRFKPTDEELVRHYLRPKVFRSHVPAQVIPDIDASEFYGTTPSSLVANSQSENKLYFFIHQTAGRNLWARTKENRVTGNGLGFWKPTGEEVPVYNLTGNIVVAFKLHFAYFSGLLPKAKKTHWKMEEFHLCCTCDAKNMEMEEWVLVRIKRHPD